jgi:hypothetical protein
MGLLDDAIREHLELKRRHGADPDEVARQENEALGEATRRAEFARPEGEAGTPSGPAAEESDAVTDEDDSAEADRLADPEDFGPPDAPVEAGDEREPFDIEAVEASSTAGPPPGAPGDPEPQDTDPWLEDRDEVPAEESLDRPRDESGEDVLEETPDFLQETPEHDRLWFEQRPPRDFDWDK